MAPRVVPVTTRKLWASRIAPTLLLLLGLAWFPKWTLDDAYILMRYARNLADHGALAFNVGSPPVEGYTGVLLPLLLAGSARLGLSPPVAAPFIGAVSFVVTLLALITLLERWRLRTPIVAAAAALLVSYPIFYTHALGGLETMVFAALLLGAVVAFDAAESRSASAIRDEYVSGHGPAEPGPSTKPMTPHVRLAVVLFLLALARPEGSLFAATAMVMMILLTARREESRPAMGRLFLVYGLGLVLPLAVYHLARWGYYGSLLPNPFYVKTIGLAGSVRGASSALDLFTFVRRFLAVPILAVSLLALPRLAGWRHAGSRPQRSESLSRSERATPSMTDASIPLLTAFGLPSLVTAVVYLGSNLTMNVSHRFFAPFLPLLLLGLAWLSSTLLANGTPRRMGTRVSAGALGLLLIQLTYNVRTLATHEADAARAYRTLLEDEHIPAGQFLRRVVPEDEWILVHIDAGAIPYYAERATIDFGGLNDRFLARSHSLEERVDYAYSENPAAMVFTSYSWDHVDHGAEATAIVSDPRFARYRLAKKYRTSETKFSSYFEFVFLRDDIRSADETIAN